MKFSLPIMALYATLITGTALPDEDAMVLRRGDEVIDGLALEVLDVQDDRFGDKVFHGTAKEVFEEMQGLKPELFTEEIGEDSEDISGDTSLVKRQSLSCSWQSPVRSWRDCSEGLRYLRRLDQARCGVNGGSCARVSCSWNCGMWLCNKRSSHHWVRCGSIANDIAYIGANCDRRGRRDFSTHYIGLRWDDC